MGRHATSTIVDTVQRAGEEDRQKAVDARAAPYDRRGLFRALLRRLQWWYHTDPLPDTADLRGTVLHDALERELVGVSSRGRP